MATVLPPPSKRQKVAAAEKSRLQQDIVPTIPTDLGSIRVQFFDQATGKSTGPAVTVPVADASVKNLETLLNTLQGNVGMDCATDEPAHEHEPRANSRFSRIPRTMKIAYHIDSYLIRTTRKNLSSTFFQISTPLC